MISMDIYFHFHYVQMHPEESIHTGRKLHHQQIVVSSGSRISLGRECQPIILARFYQKCMESAWKKLDRERAHSHLSSQLITNKFPFLQLCISVTSLAFSMVKIREHFRFQIRLHMYIHFRSVCMAPWWDISSEKAYCIRNYHASLSYL